MTPNSSKLILIWENTTLPVTIPDDTQVPESKIAITAISDIIVLRPYLSQNVSMSSVETQDDT